jgi:hypothetical protein
MAGHGPSVDPAGDIIVVTGDGPYDGKAAFGNSVLKLRVTDGRLIVRDWFTPDNVGDMDRFDGDLGSAGTTFVPGSSTLLAGGKDGRLHLIDTRAMGRGAARADSVQVTHPRIDRVEVPRGPGDVIYWSLYGAPIVWPRARGTYVFVSGAEDYIKQYRLVRDERIPGRWRFASPTPLRMSRESSPYPNFPHGQFDDPHRGPVWMPGAALALSTDADRDGTAVLWALMPYDGNANHRPVLGVLRAFDADDLSAGQLWSSENGNAPEDRVGWFAKFVPPTVANGKVYVATVGTEAHRAPGSEGMAQKPALVIYGSKASAPGVR